MKAPNRFKSEIVDSAKSKQLAVSEFIHALIQSKTFRTK